MSKYRTPRNFLPGEYYHIYNRGNNQQKIFHDDEDYEFFLYKLKECSKKTKDEIISHNLLPNHYHLSIKAFSEESISNLARSFLRSYTHYHNKKYDYKGTIYQNNFNSIHIKNPFHLIILSRYIHMNSYKHGISETKNDAVNYRWSSLTKYKNNNGDYFAKLEHVLGYFNDVQEYEKYCKSTDFLTYNKYISQEELFILMNSAINQNNSAFEAKLKSIDIS